MNFISVDTPYEQIHKHFWTHFSKKFSELRERFFSYFSLVAPYTRTERGGVYQKTKLFKNTKYCSAVMTKVVFGRDFPQKNVAECLFRHILQDTNFL